MLLDETRVAVSRAAIRNSAATLQPAASQDRRSVNGGPVRGAGRDALRKGRDPVRSVVAIFWQIFGKMLLVFGCIGADLCK